MTSRSPGSAGLPERCSRRPGEPAIAGTAMGAEMIKATSTVRARRRLQR